MQSVSPPCSRMVDLGCAGVLVPHPLVITPTPHDFHHPPAFSRQDPIDFMPPCQFDIDGPGGNDCVRMALGEPMCSGCGFGIRERFLLKVVDEFWHENCLRCCSCDQPLGNRVSCFVKNGRVFCKDDHRESVLVHS